MRHFDRGYRDLLVSPTAKDRAFVRDGKAETEGFYRSLRIEKGEKAFFQRYTDDLGWMTVLAKAA